MSTLNVAKSLFDAFHRANVRYCSWKSNDHVLEGLAGITDLDILVDRKQYLEVQQALARTGLKRGVPGCGLTFPAKEGYLGFDDRTGRLLYIDLHYRLVLGEERLKGYHFPWEELLLSTRRWDDGVGVYVAAPDAELVLLFVRAAIQLSARDVIRDLAGRRYFRGNWAKQYHWLRERIDPAKAEELCQLLLGPSAAAQFRGMVESEVTLGALRQFRRSLRPTARLFRSYPPLVGPGLLLLRRLYAWLALINRRYCGRILPFVRKGPASGGVLVVLLGPDSSGKSTIARELTAFLSWKLDVVHAYLGAGDGTSSLFRWPLVVARRALVALGLLKSRGRSSAAPARNAVPARHWAGPLYSFAKAGWALTLSLEKRRKLKRIWRARNQGLVVVSDRYPQAQVLGFNDGPLLANWLHHGNPLLRRLARWEMTPYRWASVNPPDVVIRLIVSSETAIARDPGLDLAFVQRRIAVVKSLEFGPETSIAEVDANRPLEDVLSDVKRIVWSQL